MMTRTQFENSLDSAVGFWNSKSAKEVSALLGKDVAKMVGFDQRNPHHCYDLFEHSLHTVTCLSTDVSVLLKIAAFFHDIGKTWTAREKHGRLVFYGHAVKSSGMTRTILEKLRYSKEEIEEICFYIRHHDDFISWVLPTEEYDQKNAYQVEISEGNFKKHVKKVMLEEPLFEENENRAGEIWKNLLNLCRADVMAQADIVMQGNVLRDTKKHKLEKVNLLMGCAKTVFNLCYNF